MKISFLSAKKAKGFTLIELLIVISIAGILFSLGMAQYTAFNRRQILEQALKELKGNLRDAQSMALAGKKGDDTDKCLGTLKGVMLDFSTSNSSYEIKAVCTQLGADNDLLIKSVSLPSGVTRETSEETILFKALTGAVEFLSLGSESTITLSGFGNSFSVVVKSSGEIR
jgi:prepilin-type N-terminal cleavage/methylation domain-containing protein